MITIVIGQSGAGKTTLVKKELLPEPYTIEHREIDVTRAENGRYGVGKYGIGKRTEGTDTLPYNAQKAILRTIKELADEGNDVIAEGDRINSKGVISEIIAMGHPVTLYLVTCRLETSMRRLRKAGSTIPLAFVKTTKTKSKRIYFEFMNEVTKAKIINTEGTYENSCNEG